jgi:phospholipid/cholesterol/gamma-HCH transport system permease protein
MPEIVEAVVLADRIARVRLRGDVVARNVAELDSTLTRLLVRRDLDKIELDFSQVSRVDTSAIAATDLARRSTVMRFELVNLGEQPRALFATFAGRPPVRVAPVRHIDVLDRIGDHVIGAGRAVLALGKLITATFKLAASAAIRRTRLPTRSVGDQLAAMGTDAIGVVGLLGFLVGMSIAFQAALQLRRFGAASYVGDLVGYSMVRELAPLITAMIVTGRTGAAIAAELGTMRAGSEIDALAAMGIDPVRYVVVPRVVALVIALPILSLVGTFLGLTGGMLVAELVLRTSPLAYWWRMTDRLDLVDFAHGFIKSVGYAWIIGLAASHLGLRARPDASGVGQATTRAVVAAAFWIIVFDAAFESIATVLEV